jgi:hypothetical protein
MLILTESWFYMHQHNRDEITTFQLSRWRKTSETICALFQAQAGTEEELPMLWKLA